MSNGEYAADFQTFGTTRVLAMRMRHLIEAIRVKRAGDCAERVQDMKQTYEYLRLVDHLKLHVLVRCGYSNVQQIAERIGESYR